MYVPFRRLAMAPAAFDCEASLGPLGGRHQSRASLGGTPRDARNGTFADAYLR